MLSIVIPTFNEEKYLPILLASIKNQDFKDYEIIVADNNSSDRTVEIAKSYGCQIVRGGTLCEGRNRGAEAARGELILFMDADTALSNDGLEKMIDAFTKKNLDIASFFLRPFKQSRFKNFAYDLFSNFPVFLLQKLMPLGPGHCLVTKDFHHRVGGFDEEVALLEDLIYFRSVVAAGGKFKILNDAKILFSERRYEEEGWIKTHSKLILAGIYTIFFGPIKKDIFKYYFRGHK